ncbi:MAG TPA: DUF1800 domain-containing protein [Actinomycetota bacterium]|nr:DUF1800 domain-containing protein [Actinomycetota bacterium]
METLVRRDVLAGAAAGLVGLLGLAPRTAEAGGLRTVEKQIPLKYAYDPATGITRVRSFRRKQVVVRFGKHWVLEKRGRKWVRIPYVWSPKRKALVYSRQLHLRLLKPGRPKPDPAPTDPPPKPPVETTPSPPSPSPSPEPPGPKPPVMSDNPYLAADLARHVLRRAGYGASPESLAEVAQAGGPDGWLDQQLNPQGIDDSRCEQILARLPDQAEPIWEVQHAIRSGSREGWRQLTGVHTGHVIRAAWSRRQLLTVMEEFWANHFNVTVPSDDIEESRAHYQHVIRGHSLGRFEDLLIAASLHPSMLTYLNNRDSEAEHPNENQGRELLELHTVGIEGGYDERDVLDSARILTGLSVDRESGEYEYKPWRHWVGAVRVLDFTHANQTRTGGESVARAYLRYLARHPATARRIATKLARRFVADTPPDALVQELAAEYLAHDTAITPVLRKLFDSGPFRASVGAKTSRPFESMIATIRVLGIGPEESGIGAETSLVWIAESLGQAPFGAAFPTGWADIAASWSSTAVTLNRWNTTRNLASGWWPDELTRPALRDRVLPATLPATHGEAVDAIAQALFGVPMAPQHRQAVLDFIGKSASAPLRGNSPLVTWRLAEVVSLLLDSPYHHYR